ncbi:MAG: hypothetical protein ACI4XG_28530 [Bradyrhizobium sp.]
MFRFEDMGHQLPENTTPGKKATEDTALGQAPDPFPIIRRAR